MTIENTKTIDATITNGTLHLAFSNGETIAIAPEELNSEIRNAALLHGLKQKLVDAAAISRNPDTGRSATADDKYNAVREVYDRLLSGQWNKGRGEGSGTKGGLLFRALCQLYEGKQTPEAIRAFLDKKSPAEKTALRNTAKIAAIIATFKEEPIDGIDADELLAGLED